MELGLMQLGFKSGRQVDEMSADDIDLFTAVALARQEHHARESRDEQWMANFRAGAGGNGLG